MRCYTIIMMLPYTHPEAHNLPGNAFGLPFVHRLSELSLSKARAIQWHSHNETEVICCIRGALEYEFHKRPNVTLTAGCFLAIPPKMAHRLTGGIDGPCRRVSFFLHGPTKKALGLQVFTHAEYRDILAKILKKRLRARPFPISTKNLLVHIADLSTHSFLTPREKIELRIFAANALVAFSSAKPTKFSPPQTRLIDDGLKWLECHCAETITLGQLAMYMGYSPSRLYELFKTRTGLPPMEWLIRYRISKACKLLKSGNLTIIAVAHNVGFTDPSFFSRVFRRRIGKTPTQYRKSYD